MIRLILLVILLLLSLLTVFKAPAYPLWLAAILVTEFSLYFIVSTGIVLLSRFSLQKLNLIGTAVGLVALMLFASPIVRACLLSKKLCKELPEVKSKTGNSTAFNLAVLITRANNLDLPFKDYTYAITGNYKLNMKFYPSQKEGPRPCIIVIHGGSWKSGDNAQLPELNSYLASLGYHVAAINYRLAPGYKSPVPVQDVEQALRFLKNNREELKIDTTHFILLGRSAGAQIALLAAYTLKDPGIKAVIDFYGPADMVWGYAAPASPLVMDSRKVMEDYLGGTYQQLLEQYKRSSPLLYAGKNSVPTLIIHGKNDVLVAYEHSRRLYKKLKENNVDTYFLTIPWATHGFDYTINGPSGQLSTYAVKFFLQRVCR